MVMTTTQFIGFCIHMGRLAGEMNVKGEINIPGDIETEGELERLIGDSIYYYDEDDEPFECYAEQILKENYPADYYRECRTISDWAFSKFFYGAPKENDHDGLREIPASAYQFVASALELIQWEVTGKDRATIKFARGICDCLRDQQKLREWNRRAH